MVVHIQGQVREKRGLFIFPPRSRSLLRRLAPLLLRHSFRPRRPALQAALATQCNRCRVFGWLFLCWQRRGLACGDLRDTRGELVDVQGLRLAARSFLCHACIIASSRLQCKTAHAFHQHNDGPLPGVATATGVAARIPKTLTNGRNGIWILVSSPAAWCCARAVGQRCENSARGHAL